MNDNRDSHLITAMLEPLDIKNKINSKRSNLSFATKFRSYAASSLQSKRQYSKYDSVVSNILPEYIKCYSNKDINSSEISKNQYQMNKVNKQGKKAYKHYLINLYINYSKYIDGIILKVKKEDISIEDFDHIVWYCNKGNK